MIQLILALAVSAIAGDFSDSLAREPHDQAIYFHPTISLLTFPLLDSVPFVAYLTYEKELENGKSITIQPGVISGNLTTDHDIGTPVPPMAKIFSIGVNLGYRNYFNGQVSHGFYWAPVIQASYADLSRKGDNYYRPVSATAYSFGAMGTIGYRAKWNGFTLYTDGGVGGQFVSVSGNNNTGAITGTGLLYDLNIGLGIPF